MRARVDIISGFLGAGKTTLIKKLINEKLSKEKTVIIENEFGEVGIDGSILRKSNMEVKEITSDCICCTIKQDFKKAIEEVIDKLNPDRIIIEPSGVGKLSEILKTLNVPDLKNKIMLSMIITVVDVLKYKMSSDKIIELAGQNRKVPIEEQVNLIKKPQGILSFINHKDVHQHHHYADESFSTWGIETPKIFDKQNLINKLQSIRDNKNYGTVLRAKGIVEVDKNQWIQFDYVPDEIKIVNTTPDYTGRLCIIGSNLNKENIKI